MGAFSDMIFGMIQVQFYMFSKIEIKTRDGTLHASRGEHADENDTLLQLQGGNEDG
jgi:hypothetical protein